MVNVRNEPGGYSKAFIQTEYQKPQYKSLIEQEANKIVKDVFKDEFTYHPDARICEQLPQVQIAGGQRVDETALNVFEEKVIKIAKKKGKEEVRRRTEIS